MKTIFKKYAYAWPIFAFMPVYMFVFTLAEKTITEDFHPIHCFLDDYIPFCEWFIFPYLFWFPFIAVSILTLIATDRVEYVKMSGMLMSGMTVFLIVSFVFPNGLQLRPDLSALSRDNLALRLVAALHKRDTSTNVCPSIHVYNTLCVCFAFFKTKLLRGHALIKAAILTVSILICLSTMFLKQHSVIDVIAAFLMFGVFLPVFYIWLPKRAN